MRAGDANERILAVDLLIVSRAFLQGLVPTGATPPDRGPAP